MIFFHARITLMSLLTKMMKLKVIQNQMTWMNKIVFEHTWAGSWTQRGG